MTCFGISKDRSFSDDLYQSFFLAEKYILLEWNGIVLMGL